MPTVTMPQLGEGVEEGTIGKWLKKVGDHVAVGEPIVEVVTDKVNAEVPSPFEGTLDARSSSPRARPSPTTPTWPRSSRPPAQRRAAARAQRRSRAEHPPSAAPGGGRRRRPRRPTPRRAAAPRPPKPRRPPQPPAAAAAAAGNGAAPTPPRRDRSRPSTSRPSARRVSSPAARRPRSDAWHASTRSTWPRSPAPASAAASRATTSSGRSPTAAHDRPRRPCRSRRPAAAAAAQRAAPTAAPSPVADGDSLKQLSPMRKAIAAQMTRSLEVPDGLHHDRGRHEPRSSAAASALKRDYQAREGISLSLRRVRDQGLRRGPAQAPRLQRPLDRRRATGAARPSTSASRSRSPTASSCPVIQDADTPQPPRPQRRHQRPRRARPQQASSGPRTSRAARSRWTTPAGPARS